MKKIFITLLSVCVLSLFSCLKDKPAVDFSTVGVIIEILPVNGGGLENFDAAELDFDNTEAIDSAAIVLNIASPKPLNKPLTITMEVDDALRTAYNSNGGDQYDALPDSVYSFPVSSGTIAASQRLDTLHVVFYPSKIDVSKNYMLPVSIKDAQGETISGNFGAIYFHINAQ
ncbi:MAG TPA: DUF1735 domain-containing protein [Puia sp.]|nr:DUF1735 domain-containing protein [Puia sp.]